MRIVAPIQKSSRHVRLFLCFMLSPPHVFFPMPLIGQHQSYDHFSGLSLATLGLYLALWSLSVSSCVVSSDEEKKRLIDGYTWSVYNLVEPLSLVLSDKEKKKKG